jgi:hypothetical protein
MLESAAGVIRRIDEDALHPSCKLLLKSFESEKVVATNEPIIKNVIVRDPVSGVVRFIRVFKQNSRLQLGPVFFPDPR